MASKPIFIDDVIAPQTGRALNFQATIQSYVNTYNTKLVKDIKMHCLKYKNDYILHVLIPSSKNADYIDKIFYDCVLQFYPINKQSLNDMTIRNYGIKVFCNAHSWIYTFTYIFNKSGNIPSFIGRKYLSNMAVKEEPKKTNPFGLFGIDRIVYSAMHYIMENTAFRKNRIELFSVMVKTPDELIKSVMTQDEKIQQVALEDKKLKLKREGDKKKASKVKLKSGIKAKQDRQDNLMSKMKSNMKSELSNNSLKQNKSGKSPFESTLKKRK